MMAPGTRRELNKLRELVHFLLQGAGATPFTRSEGFKCYFCGNELDTKSAFVSHGNAVGPKLMAKITVHHINGVHEDNAPMNKTLCHTTCHKRHHRKLANELRAAKQVEPFS